MVSLHGHRRTSLTDVVFDNGNLKDDPKEIKVYKDSERADGQSALGDERRGT